MLWTNRPPNSELGLNFTIIRTPAKGRYQAYVLSDDLLGLPTHYVGRRTQPCTGDGCPHCADGYSWRWHGYLCVLDPRTHQKLVIELPAQACQIICEYRDAHHTLAGALLEVWRPSQKPNGRVAAHVSHADLRGKTLPEPADLKRFLCHVWNIRTALAEIQPGPRKHPALRVREEKIPDDFNPKTGTA